MSDVKGNKTVTLRPSDSITYEWSAPPCSAADANDGAIPYGTNVDSVVVTGYKADADVSSDLISSSSVATNIVSVKLKYPALNGGGKYQLRFALTLDNAEVVNKRFDELYAKEDIS